MSENWLLFAIAILASVEVTVEGAMELYEKGKVNKYNTKNILNYSADIAEWHRKRNVTKGNS